MYLNKKVLPYLLLFFVALLLINNCFYSFCWSDEGLYVSLADNFVKGQRFFVDEWCPVQSYEPLLVPLYLLFLHFNGSSEGVYLFFRICTLLMQLFTAISLYKTLSRCYSKLSAICVALLPLIFSRASLNGPSYYTIGLQTYIWGILFLYRAFILNKRKFANCFFAGISFALSVLCNPYLVIVYIVLSLCVCIVKSLRKNIAAFLFVWLGTILCAVLYVFFVIRKTPVSEIIKSIHYVFNDPAYGKGLVLTLKRLYKMPRLYIFPYVLTYLPMLIAVIVLHKKHIQMSLRNKYIFFVIDILCFFLTVFFYEQDCGSAIMAFMHFAVYFCLLFSKMTVKEFVSMYKNELVFFIFPGMILSYFFCYASDTGFGVCSIGALVVCIGLIQIYIDSYNNGFAKILDPKFRKPLQVFPLIFLLSVTYYYRVNRIYRDTELQAHVVFVPTEKFCNKSKISRIESGPGKGLWTGNILKNQYNQILYAVNSIPKQYKAGLYIDELCPWAYVVRSNLYCAAPVLWRLPFEDFRLEPYYTKFAGHKFPDYVLVLDSSIYGNNRYSKEEDTWFKTQLDSRGYVPETFECGVLYRKP